MKISIFGDFKAIVTAVGPHFQWVESDIKIHGMAGKQVFSSKTLAGISALSQWTPCKQLLQVLGVKY